MKTRSLVIPGCLGAIALLLAGCAGSPSAAPKVTPTAAATPLPTPLVSYAQLTVPVLKTGISQGWALLGKMKSDPVTSLGNDCTTAGDDFSNLTTAFKSAQRPDGTEQVSKVAMAGFKLILGATDECGIASDSNSGSSMATARSDLKKAIGYLSSAVSIESRWHSGKA